MKPIKTVKSVKLSSRQKAWREFMAWTDAHSDSRWVFRGLADTAFELVPGAGRDPESYDPDARVVAHRVTADSIIDIDLNPHPFKCTADGIILPRALTNRISHQSGLFSVHADPTIPFEVAGNRVGASTEPFVIASEIKSYFVRRLFYFGFDPQRIMGGLDGIGARLKWQYDRNIGLGTVR